MTETSAAWMSVEELNANGGALSEKMGIEFLEASLDDAARPQSATTFAIAIPSPGTARRTSGIAATSISPLLKRRSNSSRARRASAAA